MWYGWLWEWAITDMSEGAQAFTVPVWKPSSALLRASLLVFLFLLPKNEAQGLQGAWLVLLFCFYTLKRICPNPWVLLTSKAWRLYLDIRELEVGKELRYQCPFKGRGCIIQKVSCKSSRDYSCYWKRKRLKLFMKVPGENNMEKLARFNA